MGAPRNLIGWRKSLSRYFDPIHYDLTKIELIHLFDAPNLNTGVDSCTHTNFFITTSKQLSETF